MNIVIGMLLLFVAWIVIVLLVDAGISALDKLQSVYDRRRKRNQNG